MPFMFTFLKFKKLCHQGFWQGRTVFYSLKMRTSWFALSFLYLLFSSLLRSLIQEFSGGMPSMAETSTFWLLGGKATLIAIIVHENSGIYLHKELIESWQACYSHSFSPMEEASEKPANLLVPFLQTQCWRVWALWVTGGPGCPDGQRPQSSLGSSPRHRARA